MNSIEFTYIYIEEYSLKQPDKYQIQKERIVQGNNFLSISKLYGKLENYVCRYLVVPTFMEHRETS